MTENEVYVIGRNSYGALSVDNNNNAIITRLQHVAFFSGKNINKIVCGQYYTIYVGDDDEYWCCGVNYDGELGISISTAPVQQAKQLNFFKTALQRIKIKKVCVNVGGSVTFWISQRNKTVFGNGCNSFNQLAKDGDILHSSSPLQLRALNNKNIIDMKSSYMYCVALASPNITILVKEYWGNINVPAAIINLIVFFHGFYCVYSRGNDTTGGCGHGAQFNLKWTAVQTFVNRKIIKIACGARHSLFLESNGILWAAGDSDRGQLGLGDFKNDSSMLPTAISYLVENGIKIVDIKCGLHHNLAIDENGNVYAWGDNSEGQCGDGTLTDINVPKLIDLGIGIKTVECGAFHSYVGSVDGKHFLFGYNKYRQCLVFHDAAQIKKPFCINQAIAKYKKCIKSVSLGYDETYFVLD